MKKELKLPDTIQECHAMIIEMARQIEQLQRRSFGSLKDRAVKYQGPSLFDDINEEEQKAAALRLEEAQKEVDKATEARRRAIKQNTRAKRPQKYVTTGLREEVRVEYPEGINLEEYDVIGKDVSRTLHIVRQQLYVEVVERPILRKKSDKQTPAPTIKQAQRPTGIVGHAGADLMAWVIDNKFTHHLPEYRQLKILSQMGLKLSSSTLNDWVHATADRLYSLYRLQREAVLAGGYVQIDEVPWKIADRKGKSCRSGYAWQFRDVSAHPRGTYFHYHKGSRAGEIARTQLRDYQGAIQTDGYKVYNHFENIDGVTNLACMAHIRRKFVDAQTSNPLAAEAVSYISTLYALEENLRQASATYDEIKQQRQQLAVPILEGLKTWMLAAYDTCTPGEPLARAIKYALELWPRVMRYTDDGRYLIDSNPVERGQRPSVLGRKNYLFSQNDHGAEDNAIFYTFSVSCDILGVNFLNWLQQTLERIVPDMGEEDLRAFLPYNYQSKSRPEGLL